jgi:hypothetical protein
VAHHVAHLVQTDFPQSEHYPADWMDVHAGEMAELERISVDLASRFPEGAGARILARSRERPPIG